jgi:large subunit ribosomal protein L13|tara:strand:+ start:108 stop:530 length:423 start_codon:yes stop_codon:yes gene_type:complete
MKVYDASDLVLGRLSSQVAKEALLGEEIAIVNCENAIVTGSKEAILSKFENFKNIGKPFHGPFTPKIPDRIVRRSIKRMLPYKTFRGISAYRRVMCYLGIPEQYKDSKLETINSANLSKLKYSQYMKIGDFAKLIGKYGK